MNAKEQPAATKNAQRVAAARRALRSYEPYGPTGRRAAEVRDRVVAQVRSIGPTGPGAGSTAA